MNDKALQGVARVSWLAEVSGGAVAGVVAVAYAISYAALLFPGALHELLPMGLALALVNAAIGAAWLAMRSQLPFAVGGPDGNTTSIIAASAATVAAASAPAAQQADVLWLVVCTTLVCAALFLALGFGRLGLAVRYVPYPVIGGFLASTGLLVVLGGLRVAAPDGESLLRPSVAAAAAIALVLLVVLRRPRHPLVLPGLLLGACVAVLGGLHLAGVSAQEARDQGWLFEPIEHAQWTTPFGVGVDGVHWRWIAEQGIDMLAVAVVAVITVLLGASGLEVVSRRDISLDRELREHGWMNAVAALAGGYVTLVSVSRSTVLLDSRVRTRAAGLVCAFLCAFALVGASWLLPGIPKVVLAGFLLYLGLAIMREWVVDVRRHVGRFDWLLIMTILATTAVIGFTVAVFAGVVISCLNFALSYSRVGVVQHDVSGASLRSSVQRPASHRALLAEHGSRVRVLVLRGVIFFGTATALLERLRAFLQAGAGAPARILVLDFSRVASADSSAGFTFTKLAQFAQDGRVRLVVCGLGEGTRDAVSRGMPQAHVAATLDDALDHAEHVLLQDLGEHPLAACEPIVPWLERELGGPTHAAAVHRLLQRRALATGEALMREGEASDANLFLIESGRFTVTLPGMGEGRRLATLMAGAIAGEMALYGDTGRSATVTAEYDSVVWALKRDALESLHQDAPDTAMRVHAFVVRTLAERVRQANAAAAALQRGV